MTAKDTPAVATTTENADGSTTLSLKLSEMNLDQLVQVNQALGRQRDKIRDDMLHIRGLIDKKLATQRVDAINAQIAHLVAERDGKPLPDEPGVIHGTAPGAVIEVKASKN